MIEVGTGKSVIGAFQKGAGGKEGEEIGPKDYVRISDEHEASAG